MRWNSQVHWAPDHYRQPGWRPKQVGDMTALTRAYSGEMPMERTSSQAASLFHSLYDTRGKPAKRGVTFAEAKLERFTTINTPRPVPWSGCLAIDIAFEGLEFPQVKETDVSGDGTEIKAWLEQKRPPTPLSRLCLLLCSRNDSTTRLSTLLKDDPTYDKIRQTFQLPRAFKDACQHHEFLAHVENNGSSDTSDAFGMVMRMMTFDEDGCCLGLSYDPDTGTTYALLLGLLIPGSGPVQLNRQTQKDLVNLIHESANLAWHPLFLPYLLLKLRTARASTSVNHATGLSFEFDLSMRFGDLRWQGMHDGQMSSLAAAVDFEDAIFRLNALSTDIGFTELVLKPLISYGPNLGKLFDRVDGIAARAISNHKLDKEVMNAVRRTGIQLRADAEYLHCCNEGLLYRVQHIQRKLQIQLSVIQNFIAHRDTKINKRDSASMKAIAVMTMLFLPATTIASFFAMPLFNWTADASQSIVTDRFWIFWAVTVPFTGVIMVVWALWLWVSAMLEERNSERKLSERQSMEAARAV